MPKKIKKLALNSGIQTNQSLTNDDEVCIPRRSSILLAVNSSKLQSVKKASIYLKQFLCNQYLIFNSQ